MIYPENVLQAFLWRFRQGQTGSRSANEQCECERVRIWRSEPLTTHGYSTLGGGGQGHAVRLTTC
ncbi:hypothetical protein V3W87_004577 [Salmonella enterica]